MKPRLLVVELWGLGDLIIATPFLKAASQQYQVTLLAKPYATDLLDFWPEVKVVPFVAPWTAFKHKYRLVRWPWRRIYRLRKLAHERFDIGLSARWDPRDHLLLQMLGARRRLGFPRLGSQAFLTQALANPPFQAHRYEFWRVLAHELGLELPSRDLLGGPMPAQGEVMVHSGAGQPVRVWPLERYRFLVQRLRQRNYQVQVVCDPDQRTWWLDAQEKEVATPRRVVDLIALIRRAGAFIGNDSGPGHLAACCGVPTFTVFGPQLPERFAPLHPQAQWVPGQPCRYKPCSDSCHYSTARCLWDLNGEAVWPQVGEFISRQAERLLVAPPSRFPAPGTGYRTPRPRRFIQVFCRYLMPGGEENSVVRIASHLELAGHDVLRFWRASEEWNAPGGPPFWQQFPLLWRNRAVLDQLRKLHERVQPDAWIFHNLLPVVSLATYRLARELNVPVVHWLHNYRPLSPSGTMRAGGRTLSPEDPWLAWKEARHGTWHGPLATAALAFAYHHIRRRGDFESVKAWVAVSEEMRQIFLRGRFATDRLFCLHHSWDLRPPLDLSLDEGYFLVLSRMVEEKGIRFIVDLWQRPEFRNLQLVMGGEGALADEYKGKTPANIRWVGFVRGEEKRRLLAGCRALLFPCLWAEPLTTVVYEAYEQGKPVLASALGGLKELVVDGQTGRLLEPGNHELWKRVILEFAQDPALSHELGLRGLRWLQQEVSPASWNEQFDRILERIVHPRTSAGRK